MQNYKNLHSEFMQLINAGESDYDDDEDMVGAENAAVEESKEAKGD